MNEAIKSAISAAIREGELREVGSLTDLLEEPAASSYEAYEVTFSGLGHGRAKRWEAWRMKRLVSTLEGFEP